MPRSMRLRARSLPFLVAILAAGIAPFFASGDDRDFFAYYAAIRWAVASGETPWQPWPGEPVLPADSPLARYAVERWGRTPLPFLYPPSAIAPLAPWALPPWPVARFGWRGVQGLSVCACAWAIVAAARRRGGGDFALAVALLAGHGAFVESAGLGQVSAPVAAAIALALPASSPRTGGRARGGGGAGAALGLAVGVKIYPILWLPVLVLSPGRRRAAIAFGATIGLLALSAVPFFGVGAWQEYRREVLAPMAASPPSGSISLNLASGDAFDRVAAAVAAVGCALWIPLAVGRARRRLPLGATAFAPLGFAAPLFMPHAWSHYLTISAVALGFAVARAGGRGKFDAPATLALAAFVWQTTGGGWIEDGLLASTWLPRPAIRAFAFAVPATLVACAARGFSRGGARFAFAACVAAGWALLSSLADAFPQFRSPQIGLVAGLWLPAALAADVAARRISARRGRLGRARRARNRDA